MAKLIECDRCGDVEKADLTGGGRTGWVWIDEIPTRGKPIIGRDLCASCVEALRKWLAPIPKAKPMENFYNEDRQT